jgi:hypothetical protein
VKTARWMKRNAFIDATFVMAKDGGFENRTNEGPRATFEPTED